MNSTFRATLGVVAALTLGSTAVQAQNTFQRIYNTYGWEGLSPAINVTSGMIGVDYYLQAGSSFDQPNNTTEVVVNKVDQNGNILWTRDYGDLTYNNGNKLMEAENEDYVIVGETYTVPNNFNTFDLLVTRIFAPGVLNWSNTYAGTGGHSAYGITEEPISGDLYVGGYSNGNSGGGTGTSDDFNITKLNGNGTWVWTREYGGLNSDRGANTCIGYNPNEVLISGNTFSYGVGVSGDVAVIAANQIGGAAMWAFTYGGAGFEEAYIKPVNGNAYLLVGYTNSAGAGGYDMLAIKIDQNGAVLWSRVYGTGADEQSYDFTEVSDGYVLSGFTNDGPHGGYDILAAKIDFDGNLMWSQAYGGHLNDFSYSISHAPVDDGLLIGGQTSSFHFRNASKYLIKASPDGVTCNCNNLNYPMGMENPQFDASPFTPNVEPVTLTATSNNLNTPTTLERGLCAGDFSGATYLVTNQEMEQNNEHIMMNSPGQTPASMENAITDPASLLETPGSNNGLPPSQFEVRKTGDPNQFQIFTETQENLENIEITITDARGQLIKQERINSMPATVDLSGSAAGLYIFTLKSEGQVLESLKVMNIQRK